MPTPDRTLSNTAPASSPLKRRGLILGAGAAGAAGAAALAAKALPESPAQAVAATVVADAGVGQGYRLTPHVLRYYQTAKV